MILTDRLIFRLHVAEEKLNIERAGKRSSDIDHMQEVMISGEGGSSFCDAQSVPKTEVLLRTGRLLVCYSQLITI